MAFPLPRIPTPRPPTVTLPESLLRQGRSQYLTQKGANLAQMTASYTAEEYGRERVEGVLSEKEQWEGLASDMRNPQQQEQEGEPSKFMSMLGTILKPLEPLKYLDIPIELAAEAVIDPLEMIAPGDQFNWLRGSAERENFEGWKSLMQGLKGEKKLFDVMDDIAHAFEKRPFLAQVGIGMAYGIPISKIGAISRLGRAAKPLMYTLDPAQLPFDYLLKPAVKAGYRKAMGLPKYHTAMVNLLPDDPKALNDAYLKGTGEQKYYTESQRFDSAPKLHDEEAPHYIDKFNNNERISETEYQRRVDSDLQIVGERSAVHFQHNALTNLRKFLSTSAEESGEGSIRSIVDNPEIGVSNILRSRDKALLEIQQASSARPGQIVGMSVKDMEHFIATGEVKLRSKRGAKELQEYDWIADPESRMQARLSAKQYLNILKETTPGGDELSLYDQLLGTDNSVFRTVNQDLNTYLKNAGDEKIGVNVVGAGNAELLSERLAFYNQHYSGIIRDIGSTADQPLPVLAQPLRALAATRLASQPNATPDDIKMALRHVGKSSEYRTYIEDANAVRVKDDFHFYFGELQQELDADGADILTGGYLSSLGITLRGGRVTDGVFTPYGGKSAVDLGRDDVVGTVAYKLKSGEWDIRDLEGNLIDQNKAEEIIGNYAVARSKIKSTARGKKGGYEAAMFDTTEHKDYVNLIGGIKHQQYMEKNISELDPDIAYRVNDAKNKDILSVGDEKHLHEIAANMKMREDAKKLVLNFERMRFRMDTIKTNLQRQGWVKDGKLQAERILTKDETDELVKRYGEEAVVSSDEAKRLWGDAGTSKGEVISWSDAKKLEWTVEDYSTSYLYLKQMTDRTANQLHIHEIMVAATRNKQKEILMNHQDLISLNALDDTRSGVREVFSADYWAMLEDGINVDDMKLFTEAGLPISPRTGTEWRGDLMWHNAIIKVSKSGTGGKGDISPHQLANQLAKKWKEVVLHVEDLKGFEPKNFNLKTDRSKVDAMDVVKRWLGVGGPAEEATARAQLRAVLMASGLRLGASADTIEKALQKAYNNVPQLFGSDVFSLGETVTKKGVKKIVKKESKQLATKRINLIARVLAQPEGRSIMLEAELVGGKDLLPQVVPYTAREVDLDWQERIQMLRTIVEDDGVRIGDRIVTADSATGHVPDLEFLVSQIGGSSPSRFRQAMLDLNPDGTPKLKTTIVNGEVKPLSHAHQTANWFHKRARNVMAFAAGGSANTGLTKVARLFVGRKKGHKLSEMIGQETTWQVKYLIEGPESSLKMITDDATELQKQAQEANIIDHNLAAGHQYFTGLEELNFIDNIAWKNANQTAITGYYKDGTKMSEKVRGLVQEALDVVRTNDADDFMIRAGDTNAENVQKLLTQVDAVIEELGPTYWKELYGATDTQVKDLLFLKNITASLDAKASKKGYFIKNELAKQGVTYNEDGYVPRLRRKTAFQMAKAKDNPEGIQNNMEWWLLERKDKSIFHSMAREGDTFEDLSFRLGQYAESMNKVMVDTQLNDSLRRHWKATHFLKFKNAAGTVVDEEALKAANYNTELIKNYRKMMEDIRGGYINDDLKNIANAEKVLNSDWSTLGGDLQELFKGMTKAYYDGGKLAYGLNAQQTIMGETPPALTAQQSTLKDFVKEHGDRIALLQAEELDKANDVISNLQSGKSFFGDEVYDGQKRWMQNLKLSNAEWESIDEHARLARGLWSKPVVWAALKARPPARLLRTFKAGFDVGVLLIHGFNSLVSLPTMGREGTGDILRWDRQRAWGTAAKKMIEFVKDPEHYETYMATPEAFDMRRKISPFVTLGHSEPLAATTSSSSFLKWRAQLGKVPGVGKVKAAHRAEAAFIGTLDVLRMELWKGMEETVKADYDRMVRTQGFPEWREDLTQISHEQRQAMTDFGAVINKMTGVYDSDLSALTPTQGLIENSFLFFAPMYRRATYGVIADLAKSGIRRREAARQLGGLVTAGVIMAALSEHVLGNEGAADITSPSFGKFEVGGQKMGFGTAWYTAFRLAGDMYALASADPEKADTRELLADNPILNALQRRGRSQLAPPATILVDMIAGRNYIGEPLMDLDGSRDWSAHAAYAGKQIMPFWADSVIQGNTAGVVGGFVEAAGLQSLPLSDYDKVIKTRQYLMENETGLDGLNSWRREQTAAGEQLVWSELPSKVRFDLETNNVELIQAMESYKEKWGEISRGDDRQWVVYSQRKADIDLTSSQEIAKITADFEKGAINGKKLNEGIRAIKQFRRLSHTRLVADPELRVVAERLAELREGKSPKDIVYQGDLLYDLYIADVVDNDNNYDADNNFIWDKYRAALTQFKNDHNLIERPELWNYIEDRKNRWFQENPIMVELEASKDALSPYWNIHETTFTNINDRYKASKYLKANTPHMKSMLRQTDPDIDRIAKRIEQERVRMRQNNPDIDWYLTKYHGARPITEQAKVRENLWLQMQQNANITGAVRTPHHTGYRATAAGRVIHSSLTGA